MSEIQRYDLYYMDSLLRKCSEGGYVKYGDHLDALAEKDNIIEGLCRERNNLLNCSARETDKLAALTVENGRLRQIIIKGFDSM